MTMVEIIVYVSQLEMLLYPVVTAKKITLFGRESRINM